MNKTRPNLMGSYGSWVEDISSAGGELSFLKQEWMDLDEWKQKARSKVEQLLCCLEINNDIRVSVVDQYQYNGLEIEELSWNTGYGPDTHAFFLKPEGEKEPLPGILGLHDHGGIKYFGKQKITRTGEKLHPFIKNHQATYYSGMAWANEIAKRGYGVLVHDVFPFESRKIIASHLPVHAVERMMSPPIAVEELKPEDIKTGRVNYNYDVPSGEPSEKIHMYNAFGAQHEHIIAKSLFSAGITWPGVFVAEDKAALDYLVSRPDIEKNRTGCCGLSGGGLRTNYLAGLDDRIKCAVAVGFMSTWKDFALNTCFTHTWMIYIPLLPRYLDFPEILGMRTPLPSLVLCANSDPLFSLEEVKRAEKILTQIYEKAGFPDHVKFSYYDGPHCFNSSMQDEAFDWLDRWLKG